MGVEIYIGQLSPTVNEDEVRKLFSVAGTVQSVHRFHPASGARHHKEEEPSNIVDSPHDTSALFYSGRDAGFYFYVKGISHC